MKKLHAMTLAYNDMALVEESVRLFRDQHPAWKYIPYYLVNCHWPVDKAESSKKLQAISNKYEIPILDPGKNLGVHGGWNYVIKELGLDGGDVLVGVDPDGRAQSSNWAHALMDVFNERPEMYYGTCNDDRYYKFGWHMCSHDHQTESGIRYLTFSRVVAWSLGGFDIGWVKRIGGLNQVSKYYGGIEDYVYNKATTLGGRFFKLKDHTDKHIYDVNEDYVKWKRHQCKFTLADDIDFEQWLIREGKLK